MKKCLKCRVVKTLESFYRSGRLADYLEKNAMPMTYAALCPGQNDS